MTQTARSRIALIPAFGLTALIAGCGGAPSLVLFGAYFPAWLACALIGLVVAIASRVALIAAGLAHALPLPLLVCTSIGAIAATVVWVVWVGV